MINDTLNFLQCEDFFWLQDKKRHAFEVDQFPFSEHRDAVGDEEPSIDVFAMDPDLQRDTVEDQVLIFIQKRTLVIGSNLSIKFLANVGDLCG